MLESTLQARILRKLNAVPGCKAIPLCCPPCEVGTPDIVGCYRGHFFAIEVKVGKNKSTPIQHKRLLDWAYARATATIAREDFDTDKFLEDLREGMA